MKNLAILALLAATCAPAFAQGVKTETKAEKKTEMAPNGTTKTVSKETRTAKTAPKAHVAHMTHKVHHTRKAAM